MALPKMKKKKKKKLFWQLWQCHCRKWKKKKFVLAIVAMALPKMGKKKEKKKDVTKSVKE